MTPFEILKTTCTNACHDRHACAEGYRAMLATENISQLMAVWRANWEDIVESKYGIHGFGRQSLSLRNELFRI